MMIMSDVVNNGKNALLQTAASIEKAAAYCSGNYLNSHNQKEAIGETMNYATQSLGTMIHQLSYLATTFLKVLDEKVDNLASIEDKELKIRQEKVARKAIGSCTVSKVPVKYAQSKLRQEPPADFIRRPIDYSVLDHIGHGFKSQGSRTRKQSEPANSSYGGQNVHAQTMSRRSSTTAHPMGCPGGVHDRQVGTIDPKVLGPRASAEYAASSIARGAPGRFQSGTLGRTAGIYRSGVYGHQSIITSSAANCQLPANQIVHQMDLANPSARSNSPSGSALAVGSGTNSLGHAARRTNSASGVIPVQVPSQRAASTYAPGGQQVDYQGQQQQLRMPANQLEQFAMAGYPGQPRSPGHQQQPVTTEIILQRQQSEPAVGQHHHPPAPAPPAAAQQQQAYVQPVGGTPIHHFPNQYTGSQPAFNATDLAQETNKMKIHNNMPPPPPPVPTEMERTAAAVRQSRVTSVMQAAAIDQLDSVVSMPLPPAVAVVNQQQPQHQAQPQPQEQQQASAVDISRLQPSPMDQLRPRRPDDAPWAPNQYIQKVITVYEYTADKNDELTFGENELIYVIKKNDDGWWEGVMSGSTGLFPGNYVESIE